MSYCILYSLTYLGGDGGRSAVAISDRCDPLWWAVLGEGIEIASLEMKEGSC